ncbi:4-fold beta flower protein [Nocardia amikacinitolerans]|uniref:4-fold beta flower protein n=1 Tax=Nocardia amikacinitolerans TaxID=756689 RepID=UPI003679DB0B
MTDYLYRVDGHAAGFRRGRFIYDMAGRPIGQISSAGPVHRLQGDYVGEIHDDQIVDMHLGNFGNIGNPGNPGNLGSPGNPGNRGRRGCPYPDVFDNLL